MALLLSYNRIEGLKSCSTEEQVESLGRINEKERWKLSLNFNI